MTSSAKPYEHDETAGEVISALAQYFHDSDEFKFPADQARACALGYGWWVGVLRMAEAIRHLYLLHFRHEASPPIRTVLHHTGALIWLEREPDVVLAAILHEHPVQTALLFNHAVNRQWDVSDLEEVPRKPSGPAPPGAALLDNFEQLSKRIDQPNLYVPYKIESAYVHPSGLSSNTYLALEDGRVVGRPSAEAAPIPLGATAQFALMATDAFARLIGDPILRELVADRAERLGVAL